MVTITAESAMPLYSSSLDNGVVGSTKYATAATKVISSQPVVIRLTDP